MAEFKCIEEAASESEDAAWKEPRLPFTGWVFLNPEEDLGIAFVEGDDVEIPDWLDYEIGEIGLDYLLSIKTDLEGWAFREGIAPGQPFLICIDPPHYSQDYWGEWDAECVWELLEKKPYTDAMALEAWLTWFKDWVQIPIIGA